MDRRTPGSLIPIRNLYYLLVYAWDVLEEAEEIEARSRDCTQLVDLFARLLHAGTEKLVRRGLDRGYKELREELPGIRGKLNVSESLKRQTLPNGRAFCEFEELSHDVLHNRVIRSTIRRLLQVPDLSPATRDELSTTFYRLHQVSDVELSSRIFRSVQLHRNNRRYRLLLDICRLIHDAGLLHEEAGETRFVEFIRDEHRMRRLFEKFVRNFYRREQRELRVVPNTLRWARLTGDPASCGLIPAMRTDIRLVSPRRCVVIETKFVPEMLQTYYGAEGLRSSHIYQLHTYLCNIVPSATQRVEGILLYPAVGRNLALRVELNGFPLQAFALDLSQEWRGIRDDLLRLLGAGRRVSARMSAATAASRSAPAAARLL